MGLHEQLVLQGDHPFQPHQSMHRIIIVKASDGDNLGKGKFSLATELIYLILGVHYLFFKIDQILSWERIYIT